MAGAATMSIIAAVLLAVAAVLLVLWRRTHAQAASLAKEVEERQATTEELATRREELQRQVDRLVRWEGVADADERASQILREAQAASESLKADSAAALAAAQAEARSLREALEGELRTMRTAAAEKAKATVEYAERVLEDARARASSMVADAETQAQSTAGDALKALRDAKVLEKAVEAMKNTIEGYGDRYLIPRHTFLDDLADGFGHAEAGQQLKVVRDRVRAELRDGRAAACDYAEANRRETAIRFIVDAFNGKVDSTLARVRSDNAGTLEQEIKDAFAVVNMNGQAFRNARITPEFLALRLEELRWASAVQELKEQEREEQRRIREQIREEEKARREYERAMKDAARDEDVARKAMEKAQQQLAKASEEQKAKFEEQLRELEGRLHQAEERNRRALSMAQQTRRGHVYVISNVGSLGENVYKIGLTRRLEPLDRVRELGDSSVPFEFDVHALIYAEDAPSLERQLHKHFLLTQVNKVNPRKEFFRADLAHIREETEKLGLVANWTMVAKAAEYRESLRIDELIAEDSAARTAWEHRQLELEPSFAFEDDARAEVATTHAVQE